MIASVSTGGSGLLQAFSRADAAAGRLAATGAAPDADPARDAVALVEAKADVAANGAVIRATDELHRRLLDLRV